MSALGYNWWARFFNYFQPGKGGYSFKTGGQTTGGAKQVSYYNKGNKYSKGGSSGSSYGSKGGFTQTKYRKKVKK